MQSTRMNFRSKNFKAMLILIDVLQLLRRNFVDAVSTSMFQNSSLHFTLMNRLGKDAKKLMDHRN